MIVNSASHRKLSFDWPTGEGRHHKDSKKLSKLIKNFFQWAKLGLAAMYVKAYSLFFAKIHIGNRYCNADMPELNLEGTNGDNQENCQKLVNETLDDSRFRIKCSPFIGGYPYPPCSRWCELFALCFNETKTRGWVTRCSNKFRVLAQRFVVATKGRTFFSSVTQIRVKPCRPSRKGYFIVRINTCRCGARNRGM